MPRRLNGGSPGAVNNSLGRDGQAPPSIPAFPDNERHVELTLDPALIRIVIRIISCDSKPAS
jgi:hypothetical protein